MAQHEKPMSLENLPEHLKSNTGSNLVDMGQIVVTEKRSYMKRILFAMVMFMAIGTGGMVTYDMMSTKQFTVVVDVDRGVDPQAIAKIVSDSGGEVLSVTHMEDSTYEVEVSTRKSRSSFLEWFRKNEDVKKAELEE